MRILRYLQDVLGASDAQKTDWYRHWIAEGMAAVERCCNATATAPIASATRPRWPTAAWCPRWPTRSAWAAI